MNNYEKLVPFFKFLRKISLNFFFNKKLLNSIIHVLLQCIWQNCLNNLL